MTPNNTPEKSTERLDELDGLRGLLALWVAMSHVFCWTGYWEFTGPRRLERVWGIFISAGPAVEVFMILSGFAISFLIHKRRQTYGQFMTGRFFRIYPVYLVCLFAGLAAMHLTPYIIRTAAWHDTVYFEWQRAVSASESTSPGPHVIGHLLLLNGLIPASWLPNATATVLTPAWSISLEWQYYLAAPLLALLARSAGGLLVCAVVAWLGLRYGSIWQNPHLAFLPAQLPLFLLGIGSHQLYIRYADKISGRSSIYGLAVVALVGVSVLASWHAAALAAWAVGFSCIFIRGTNPIAGLFTFLRRVLLHPWLQRLGRISYPLYLVHWPLILAFVAALLHWFPAITSRQALAFMLALGMPAILGAAALLHHWVELPLMAFGKRCSSRAEARG